MFKMMNKENIKFIVGNFDKKNYFNKINLK